MKSYFDIVNNLYTSIKNNDVSKQKYFAQQLTAVTNQIASYIDKILGVDIFGNYMQEYMKLYIADIYAIVNKDLFRDTQYTQAMFNIGLEMMNHFVVC